MRKYLLTLVASAALSGGYQAAYGLTVPCPTVLRSEPFIEYLAAYDAIYVEFPWRCGSTGGIGCNWYYELHVWNSTNQWVEGACVTSGGKCGQYGQFQGQIAGVSNRYVAGQYHATVDVYNGTCADKAHSTWLGASSCTFAVQ